MMLLRWVLHKVVIKLSGDASGGVLPRPPTGVRVGFSVRPTIRWLNAEEFVNGVSMLSHQRNRNRGLPICMAAAMLAALQETLRGE